MLLMRKEFFDAIRSGAKTTTLRFWKHAHVRAGSIHTVRGLDRLRIEDIRRASLDGLTDGDARRDGFRNLTELRMALDQMYPPPQRDGRELYRICFTFLGPETPGRE